MSEDDKFHLPPRVAPAGSKEPPVLAHGVPASYKPDESKFVPPHVLPRSVDVEQRFPLDPLFKFPESRPGITVLAVDKSMENRSHQSEDACAISRDETRLAICDGVSQSSIPRPWASLIANKWVEDPLVALDSQSWNEWLRDSRETWADWIKNKWDDHINRFNVLAGRPLIDSANQHSVQRVLEGGPSTTFLGVSIDKSKAELQAIAIGDSNMVLINPNTGAFRSFPLQDPSEFTSSPYQISNKAGKDTTIRGVSVTTKSFERGELLVMATDKFSEWLLKGLKQDFKGTVDKIQNLDQAKFRQLAMQERGLGTPHSADDDLTVMVVDLSRYFGPPLRPGVYSPIPSRPPGYRR